MKLYLAPMEGYTNYVYRNIHKKYYHKMDKYFTPFIATNKKASLNSKELKDIHPDENQGLNIIPQLMTNHAGDCISTYQRIKSLGYEEVNINMGCPSGTVTNKGRGAGMLYDTDKLQLFLDELFQNPPLKISIKTRLGRYEADEFYSILEIFNQYPLEELIIHPRTREDYYKNSPNINMFIEAMKISKNPLCYNGNVFSVQDYKKLIETIPSLNRLMIGRGLIGNPELADDIYDVIKNNQNLNENRNLKKIKDFHDELLLVNSAILSGDTNILYKMKSYWVYMGDVFCDRKTIKKIKKTNNLEEYKSIVDTIWYVH